jgi:endonuclease-3
MKYDEIIRELNISFPNAKCELLYNKDYELLLAVMLSAQTTDKRVNMVTVPLFKEYNTLEKLDFLTIEQVENYIRTIGLYKVKALNFKKVVSSLINIGGVVPYNREVLESLPGVGRKTANVVLANLFNEPCFAVDTHVNRVSKRFGIANEDDSVGTVEIKLMKFFPKENWNSLHHQLVLFGRYICKSQRPECTNCAFNGKCEYTKNKKRI